MMQCDWIMGDTPSGRLTNPTYINMFILVLLFKKKTKKRISIMQACQLTQYIMNINLQNKKNKIKEEAHGPHRSPEQQ